MLAGNVIVVNDPEIDVVTVLAGKTIVVGTDISEVTVLADWVTTFVTVEAGNVIVVKDPEIDVVTVLAGKVIVVRTKISDVTVLAGSV